ncbi:hypothetical protein VFPPC_15946 [Pochonia chlamydosporia 170]|uniref:Uncharacterized protein n=1 Tax=Pochonia chlamydosporia 170 TaxID=1380566 RepID=A0A179FKC5_METCM|nr:hypothetical protein VFPPC_15946 [Pochonia chlamydosporia 170]OAQ65788.1 hypothetical protein VFPPC_15946 [Pochonia chlamydosporia 170]
MASCAAIDVLRGMCSETSIDINFDRIVPQGRRRDASSTLIVMAGNTHGRMDDKNEEDTSNRFGTQKSAAVSRKLTALLVSISDHLHIVFPWAERHQMLNRLGQGDYDSSVREPSCSNLGMMRLGRTMRRNHIF